jgi:hypothetical protein
MINIRFIWQDNKNNFNSYNYCINKEINQLKINDLILYYKNIEKNKIIFTRFERHFKYKKIIKRHNDLIKKRNLKRKPKKKNKKNRKSSIFIFNNKSKKLNTNLKNHNTNLKNHNTNLKNHNTNLKNQYNNGYNNENKINIDNIDSLNNNSNRYNDDIYNNDDNENNIRYKKNIDIIFEDNINSSDYIKKSNENKNNIFYKLFGVKKNINLTRKNKHNLTVKSIISLSDTDEENLHVYTTHKNLFLKPLKLYKDPFNLDHDSINYIWVYSILSNTHDTLKKKKAFQENIFNHNYTTYDVTVNKYNLNNPYYNDYYDIKKNINYDGKIFYYNSKTYKIINNPIYENENYTNDKKIKFMDKIKESKQAIKNDKLIKYFKCNELNYLNYLKSAKLKNVSLDFKYEKIINKFIHDEKYIKMNIYFKFFQSFIILTPDYLPVFFIKRKIYKFHRNMKIFTKDINDTKNNALYEQYCLKSDRYCYNKELVNRFIDNLRYKIALLLKLPTTNNINIILYNKYGQYQIILEGYGIDVIHNLIIIRYLIIETAKLFKLHITFNNYKYEDKINKIVLDNFCYINYCNYYLNNLNLEKRNYNQKIYYLTYMDYLANIFNKFCFQNAKTDEIIKRYMMFNFFFGEANKYQIQNIKFFNHKNLKKYKNSYVSNQVINKYKWNIYTYSNKLENKHDNTISNYFIDFYDKEIIYDKLHIKEKRAGGDFSPYILCNYLTQLMIDFDKYYNINLKSYQININSLNDKENNKYGYNIYQKNIINEELFNTLSKDERIIIYNINYLRQDIINKFHGLIFNNYKY